MNQHYIRIYSKICKEIRKILLTINTPITAANGILGKEEKEKFEEDNEMDKVEENLDLTDRINGENKKYLKK